MNTVIVVILTIFLDETNPWHDPKMLKDIYELTRQADVVAAVMRLRTPEEATTEYIFHEFKTIVDADMKPLRLLEKMFDQGNYNKTAYYYLHLKNILVSYGNLKNFENRSADVRLTQVQEVFYMINNYWLSIQKMGIFRYPYSNETLFPPPYPLDTHESYYEFPSGHISGLSDSSGFSDIYPDDIYKDNPNNISNCPKC
uniref:Phospholipase B-like n=1 Tax=Clastoptera arizonana TaxID=38151 RepID=A0A1B6EGX5_9HEMI